MNEWEEGADQPRLCDFPCPAGPLEMMTEAGRSSRPFRVDSPGRTTVRTCSAHREHLWARARWERRLVLVGIEGLPGGVDLLQAMGWPGRRLQLLEHQLDPADQGLEVGLRLWRAADEAERQVVDQGGSRGPPGRGEARRRAAAPPSPGSCGGGSSPSRPRPAGSGPGCPPPPFWRRSGDPASASGGKDVGGGGSWRIRTANRWRRSWKGAKGIIIAPKDAESHVQNFPSGGQDRHGRVRRKGEGAPVGQEDVLAPGAPRRLLRRPVRPLALEGRRSR